jgi:hypothetical protein
MARAYFINGETMVYVKGAAGTAIASLTELGLSDTEVRIILGSKYDDIKVNAYGEMVPPEIQVFGGEARLSFTLVHFDQAVLRECIRLANAAPVEGQEGRAGTLMGGGVALGVAGNNYVQFGFSSPIGQLPWRFFACILTDSPEWPVGTHRSIVQCNVRAIPYSVDPWNNGTGLLGVPLYDHNQPS